jgi:hypothetical protein
MPLLGIFSRKSKSGSSLSTSEYDFITASGSQFSRTPSDSQSHETSPQGSSSKLRLPFRRKSPAVNNPYRDHAPQLDLSTVDTELDFELLHPPPKGAVFSDINGGPSSTRSLPATVSSSKPNSVPLPQGYNHNVIPAHSSRHKFTSYKDRQLFFLVQLQF